jgi:hypothetical protein
MSRRIVKWAAVILLVAIVLAGAYGAGAYHGFNKGYLQGKKEAAPETREKPDMNRLFLQS